MSTLGREAGISKPIHSKPRATVSKFIADMRADGVYISPKSESSIRKEYLAWIRENKWNLDNKKNKFLEIANTCLTFSDLSDLEPDNSNSEFLDVDDCQLPEVDLKWMIEKPSKNVLQKSATISQLPTLPEPSISRTLRRILVTNFLIYYYLNDGQYKN
jgi:hypothetical protein